MGDNFQAAVGETLTSVAKQQKELLDLFAEHLRRNQSKPAPLIIPSRYRLFTRRQLENESIITYVTELQILAADCKYDSEMFSVILRDVFISGLRSKTIVDRLLKEDDPTFSQVLQIALQAERVTQQVPDASSNQVVNSETASANVSASVAENQTNVSSKAQNQTNVSKSLRNVRLEKLPSSAEFQVGEKVMVQNFFDPTRPWAFGSVVKCCAPHTYSVNVNGVLYKRGIHQIRKLIASQNSATLTQPSLTVTPSTLTQNSAPTCSELGTNSTSELQETTDETTSPDQSSANGRLGRARRPPARFSPYVVENYDA